MSLVNIKGLFNRDEFSDITICFGEQKIKCHKMILCLASEYFDKLCGPNSSFAEKALKEITLHDDNPIALEELFRFIYSYTYDEGGAFDWKTHFHIYMASQKYTVPTLSEFALDGLRATTQHYRAQDSAYIWEVILFLESEGDETIFAFAEELQNRYLGILLREKGFRSRLEEDDELLDKCADHLQRAGSPDLVEVQVNICMNGATTNDREVILQKKGAKLSPWWNYSPACEGISRSPCWIRTEIAAALNLI